MYYFCDMIELAKHIKALLLENDCVIVPGFGGFIAHKRPAAYSAETHTFEPPLRTIGFNPKLVINDGLLVQSYMQAYNTDFPDATRKIENMVNSLKEQLYEQGFVKLNQIGTLFYNMNGVYEFEPAECSFFTPSLYGLHEFSFFPLTALRKEKTALPTLAAEAGGSGRSVLPFHKLWRSAVAVAAAILLFLILSTPVENTYLDDANFASLGSIDMFDVIRDKSVATTLQVQQKQTDAQKVRNNVNTLKPVTVKTEVVKPASVQETAEKKAEPAKEVKAATATPSGAKSYIIVASLSNGNDARRMLDKFRKEGYEDAEIVESDGRYRIALCHYPNSTEAYRRVQELRQDEKFKNAWVFTRK